MIVFIMIVAIVLLLDVSGGNLNERILPLVYIVDLDEEEKILDEDLSDLSPEQLAARAQDAIFDKGESDDVQEEI